MWREIGKISHVSKYYEMAMTAYGMCSPTSDLCLMWKEFGKR